MADKPKSLNEQVAEILEHYDHLTPRAKQAVIFYWKQDPDNKNKTAAMIAAGYSALHARRNMAQFWAGPHHVGATQPLQADTESLLAALEGGKITPQLVEGVGYKILTEGSLEQKSRALATKYITSKAGVDDGERLEPPIFFEPDALAKVGRDATEIAPIALDSEAESVGSEPHEEKAKVS